MRLEAVTAELRPRSDWESIDLGLALARTDFWRLSGAWWIGMLPVMALAPLLRDHPFWFCFIFWWWIPVASRLALFRMSRRLFGDQPGWKDVFRELPRAMVRRFFYRMIWARLSPWRPLTMPVAELEGLRGKEFSARARVLMRRGDSSLVVLAIWRLCLSFWVSVALFFTVMLFLPAGVSAVWSEVLQLWFDGDPAVAPAGMSVVLAASVCGALWLVDLFSVGAGFGVYVNHRTWVEGWDVELAFRRMANRLGGAAGAILMAAGLCLAGAGEVRAQDTPGDRIDEVLAAPEFIVHQETTKRPDFSSWNWNWGGGGGGGAFLEALVMLVKVLAIGAVVALLVWLIYRYRHIFTGAGGTRARKEKPVARVVMGMDVAPETLPDDVAAAALELWREGRRKEAMGLLYRGAISWMIARESVEIAESDTESDCLARARGAKVRDAEYFAGLTREWMRMAYAREEPGDEVVEKLCGEWPFREGRAG